MKIKDILTESPTDVVARFYKEAGSNFDKFNNKEASEYKAKNSDYYEEHFNKWFNEDIVPVFTKPVDKPQPEYNVIPKQDKLQSPGYRGLQYALQSAGLPYNHNVQSYKPNAANIVATQTMDGARTTNGT